MSDLLVVANLLFVFFSARKRKQYGVKLLLQCIQEKYPSLIAEIERPIH